jgi:hypothetical protein
MTGRYPIPDEALESHIAVLGKTGSGKSNAAKTLAERLIYNDQRVCVIDPTGTWWGLRLEKSGKRQSALKPVIFGGEHADMPIMPAHGQTIGEAIGSSDGSSIIDMRQMSTKGRTEFFIGFAERLMATNRGPLWLFIDEAHLFAPKGRVNSPLAGEMLSVANNLVSLGRGLGLRIVMITQRTAKLHNDSLSQIETLIVLRMVHPLDKEAVRLWIKDSADPATGDKVIAALQSLPVGDAYVWSPEIGYLERDHFPLASTFDSGSGRLTSGTDLVALDTSAIAAKLEQIKADVFANDPARLKAEIARLKRDLAAKPETASAEQLKEAGEKGYSAGYKEGRADGQHDAWVEGESAIRAELGRLQQDAESVVRDATAVYRSLKSLDQALAKIAKDAPAARTPVNGPQSAASAPRSPPPAPRPAPLARPAAPESGGISLGAERKPLGLLVSCYPAGYSEAQWATLAGYKRTGGTWGAYKSRLRSAGLVEERGKLWYATEDGLEAGGGEAVDLPTTPEGLIDMWKSRISGVGPMLDVLAAAYPASLMREEIAHRLGMAASGGTFGTYLSRLRSNGLVEEPVRSAFRITPAIMEA